MILAHPVIHNIVSATFGPLPLPDRLLDSISKSVSDTLKDQIASQAGGKVRLTSITIDDGVLTAKGMKAE